MHDQPHQPVRTTSGHGTPPRGATTSRREAPSLRRAWARATTRLVLIIVVLGVVSVGGVEFQGRLFKQTTSVLQHDMSAVVEADLAHVAITEPASGLMYRIGGRSHEQNAVAYTEAGARLNDALRHLERSVSSEEARVLVAEAASSWATTDAGIRAASEVSEEAIIAAFTSGGDPYADTVWKPYNETVVTFSKLAQQVVRDLEARAEGASDMQRFIIPTVVVSLAFALLVAWATARLVSRRVVAPLVELRRGAVALRHSETASVIHLEGSVAELQDIADVFNDTARSLQESHGLLRRRALTDVLTDLPNRDAFTDHVRTRLAAPGSGSVSVLFVDLDDFKIVNDSLGHAAGDELLRIVAARLGSLVRESEMVARLGGDEFAVVVGGDADAAATVARRILASLESVVPLGSTQVRVGCSVGVSTSDEGSATTVDELTRQADFAMYMAKSQGKRCYEVYSGEMHDAVANRSRLKEQVSNAASRNELVLHYQPVVEPASGAVTGFEALVRWNHPERGLVGPGEFIELAEETGAIVGIGEWVLKRACADLAHLHRQVGSTSQWMSVNVSPLQITSPTFEGTVAEALAANDLHPTALVLEVTESAAMTTCTHSRETLDALRRSGVRIALDDFGTGFSSLNQLHDLPVDVIKIDRSFVSDLSSRGDAMIDLILALALKLHMNVIAEGVENEDELSRLDGHSGLAVQGYYFARPAPAPLLPRNVRPAERVTAEPVSA